MDKLINGGIYSIGLGVAKEKYAIFVVIGQNHNTVVGFEVSNVNEDFNNQNEIIKIISYILDVPNFNMETIFDMYTERFQNLTTGFMETLPDEIFDKLKTIARTRYDWI